MPCITICSDQLELKLAPAVGGSILSMRYKVGDQWVDLLRPTPETALTNKDPGQFSSFVMMPYSNRIERGKLQHGGAIYQLPCNSPDGHAIHGNVRSAALAVISRHKDRVNLAATLDAGPQWPFCYETRHEYRIEGGRLVLSLQLTNRDKYPMPAGFGIHPYFMRRLTDSDDQVLVQIPTIGVYPGTTPIPDGPAESIPSSMDFNWLRPLPETFLDRCFQADSRPVRLRWPGTGVELVMESSPVFSHSVVYCPPDAPGYFAVEPATNCNNGFNLAATGWDDTGVVELAPGASMQGQITMTVQPTCLP